MCRLSDGRPGAAVELPQDRRAGEGTVVCTQNTSLQLILRTGLHGLGFLHKISTSSSQFRVCACFVTIVLARFSCYLPLTKPDLMCLYRCSYTDIACPRCPWEYEYGDLAPQVGRVSNLKQESMATSSWGLKSENNCADDGQQQL